MEDFAPKLQHRVLPYRLWVVDDLWMLAMMIMLVVLGLILTK